MRARTLGLVIWVVVGAVVGSPRAAHAQSFNIAFGNGEAPSSSYGAAGAVGYWNRFLGACTPDCATYDVMDLDGNPTGVTVTQHAIAGVLAGSDTTVSGDDALLLNNGIFDNTDFGNNICAQLNGLQDGTYELLEYAWMPGEPTVKTLTIQDSPSEQVEVGGAWPGRHEEGVTYARFVMQWSSGTSSITYHAGLVEGASATKGSSMNGIQVRPCLATTDAGGCAVASGGGDDAGVSADAGVRADAGGGGGNDNPDAGVTGPPTAHHSGGCSAGGTEGGCGGVMLLALGAVVCRRRGRR